MTPPRASVVVLSKDERSIELTLAMLQVDRTDEAVHIVVIDASEGRLDDIRKQHPRVEWINFSPLFWRTSTIPQQRNLGLAIAHDRGSPIVAFCDAGCEPGPGWLDALIAPIEKGEAVLTCGRVGAKRSGVFRALNDYPSGARVRHAATCNLALSLDFRVGLFDTRLFYGSDVDLTTRAHELGNPCLVVGGAEMVMDFGDAKQSRKRAWRYGRAWARTLWFNPRRFFFELRNAPERILYPSLLVGAVIGLILLWSIPGRIALLGVMLLTLVLLIKNLLARNGLSVVVAHFVEGAGILAEIARHLVGESKPIRIGATNGWRPPSPRSAADSVRSKEYESATFLGDKDVPRVLEWWYYLRGVRIQVSARPRRSRSLFKTVEPGEDYWSRLFAAGDEVSRGGK